MAQRPPGPADRRRLAVPEAPEVDETTGSPRSDGFAGAAGSNRAEGARGAAVGSRADGARGEVGAHGARGEVGAQGAVDEWAWRRGDWERATTGRGDGGTRQTRTELAAARLGAIAAAAVPGDRLGSKDELRGQCGVSVGTFNEAIRLLQARKLVTVRPGPGGGLFAAEPSPMVRLGNSVLALDAEETSVADAVRIREALDPLIIEDALWHASPADLADLRARVRRMREAADELDPIGFIRANWGLHARIAAVSPNVMLRSLYTSLLDLIESHTLSVLPVSEQPLLEYVAQRYQLHARLVEAIAGRDRALALHLIDEHNTTDLLKPVSVPGG
jgi:DNA-binding FadR family transcriptional regulator